MRAISSLHFKTGDELRNSRPLNRHVWSNKREVNQFIDTIIYDHFDDVSNIKSDQLKALSLIKLFKIIS